MSKQEKNITNTDELINAPLLSKLQDKNSISVPDGYFDKLEDDIMAQINTQSVSDIKPVSYKKMMYYVAAASVIVLLSFFAIRFVDNDSTNEVVIENEVPSNTNLNKTVNNIEKPSTDNSANEVIVDNNENKIKIETQNPKTDIVINTDEVRTVEPSVNTIEENNVNNNIANKNTIKQKQIIADNTIINEDDNTEILALNNAGSITAAQSYSSSNSHISTPNTTVARTSDSNPNSKSNIILPNDTCVNKAFVIDIEDDSLLNNMEVIWSNGSTNKQFEFVKSGTYYVEFYKSDKLYNTDTIKVSIIPIPEIYLAQQFEMCNHQSLLLNTGLNDEVFKHYWSISDSHKAEILLENLEPGYQDIELKVESCCDTIVEVIALNIQDCNIEIPNIITPNGDGFNDAFVVKGLEYYSNSSLNIFDRNGKVIFQTNDYHNDWKANDIPNGTYFYSLIINDDKKTEKGGVLKVMR